MVDKEEALRLSRTGMTHSEIALKLGCSRQYINMICSGKNATHQRRVSVHDWIVYPNIKKWLFENQVSMAKFVQLVSGKDSQGRRMDHFRKCLAGQSEFKFNQIKEILELTGMTFEKAFEVENDEL